MSGMTPCPTRMLACVITAEDGAGGAGRIAASDIAPVALWSADDARRLTGIGGAINETSAPRIAATLRERGVTTVCVMSVPHGDARSLHWLDAEHARGWIEPAAAAGNVAGDDSRRDANGGARRDPRRFARAMADALERGFVGADAALLACAGAGRALPRLSWGLHAVFAPAHAATRARQIGIYAIVSSARQLRQALDAGVRTVQLRIKRPADAGPSWEAMLRSETEACVATSRQANAEFILNDDWQLAIELGIGVAHLGQEDLMLLGEAGRASLMASGVGLGVSSHSVWELCRARALGPRYIACGPVWPTTTKDMPWLPQGPANLAWWCRHAGAPVVAIGGLLDPEEVRAAASAGADGACLVRALGDDPHTTVPAFQQAFARGCGERRTGDSASFLWPNPTLPSPLARA